MSNNEYLKRYAALEFAIKSQRENTTPDEIASAAERYLAFLTDDTKEPK